MSIYKFLTFLSLSASLCLLIRCGSAPIKNMQDPMVLSQPTFAQSPAYFNTYVAGVRGGGSGIEFYLEIDDLPAGVVLEKLYFRKGSGIVMRGSNNYVARFRTDQGENKDVIMSSDPNEEASNTPPIIQESFPFPITKDEAGLVYKQDGVLKYAKITDIEEQENVAYPSQKPKGNGY